MKNKMNKTMKFLSMAALALVGAVMTGCSNDDIMDIEQPGNDNVERLTVVANLDGSTTRALTAEGVKTYEAGDQIAVIYKNTSDETKVAVSDALTDGDITSEGKSAKFTVTLESADKTKAVTYIYPAYMAKEDGSVNYDALYKEQDGTLATLGKKFDYCTFSGAWSGEELPAASLGNQLFVCEFTLKYSDASINDKVTAMTISDNATHNYYVNVDRTPSDDPIYVAIIPTNDNNINYTAIAAGKVYTKSVTGKTYAAGTMRPIHLNMIQNNDLVPGLFSVSANKRVYFAKGNLQLVSENSWKFADNQWDYFGDSQSENHRDLFGWGTGNNPNQTSEDNDNYATFTDWGNNSILQAQLGTGWYTLSKDEWHYLFKTRTVNGGTGAGHSYTLGQSVNDKPGVVIYPDNYAGETYDTGDNWSTFEAAGCVFLPAAGARWGNTVGHIGDGYYWSSTPNFNFAFNAAYSVYITSDLLYTENSPYGCYVGQSVRLVRDVVAP